jgi:regulator of protease activity HflC (stomatin/prohibitin superfamily)
MMQRRNIIVFSLAILGVIAALLWAYPKYRVWYKRQAGLAELAEAEFSRQIAIVEAEAKEKSAEALGNAEVIRAMKLAEANKILGESLRDNEAYLRYLWITQVAAGQQEGDTTIIYLPGQDFLPFSTTLETGRAAQ